MAKGCPNPEGKERLISPFASACPYIAASRKLPNRYPPLSVWRMSNHERMAASGIRGGGAERPSWARSGSSRRAPSSARMGRGDHHRGTTAIAKDIMGALLAGARLVRATAYC